MHKTWVFGRSWHVAWSIGPGLVAIAQFLSGSAAGQSVSLAWDPSTDPTAAGYNVYYGGAAQYYTNVVPVGNVTTATISGLLPGNQYFLAVTEVDSLGLESAFSNEISYQVPGGQTGPAPPPVTWATPASIVYGTALGAAQLNATSSVPGIFTYTPPAGRVLNAGNQVLSVTFNPTATNSYVPVTTNVTLVVLPVSLTITAANASKLYGAPLPALTPSYSGFVNGDTASSLTSPPALSTTATAASPVGSYLIAASDAASPNYAFIYIPGTLMVTKASTAGLLSSSGNPSPPGQAVTLTVSLSAVAPGAGTPTGTVQFVVDGGAAGAPVSLAGATASYSTTLAHGSHTVAGQYPGDGNFLGITNLLSSPQVIDTPPVAGAMTLYRALAAGVQVTIAELLTNVSDGDGDPITLLGVSATSAGGGSVMTNTGWIFYTPAPGFTNTDSFTYLVSDGWSAPVAGTVTVEHHG